MDNLGSIVTENKAAADLLNNYLSTVFTKEDHTLFQIHL